MNKRRKRERHGVEATPAHASSKRRPRDVPLAVLAGLGMLLTGVLLWKAGAALPYCGEGSGCDAVQSSAWSRFLGLPLALWGFGAYTVLGLVALGVAKPVKRARWAAFFASAGFAVSVYLTVVSVVLIEALCAWCLGSLALMTAAFALSFRLTDGSRPHRWQFGGLLVAALLVGVMHAQALGMLGGAGGAADPYLRELAEHLDQRGFRFYGASWCPHCQEQKALFGGAARYLPYVECSPHGRNAPRATTCELEDIRNYPTWVIDGRRLERVITPRSLARMSGFRPPDGAQ